MVNEINVLNGDILEGLELTSLSDDTEINVFDLGQISNSFAPIYLPNAIHVNNIGTLYSLEIYNYPQATIFSDEGSTIEINGDMKGGIYNDGYITNSGIKSVIDINGKIDGNIENAGTISNTGFGVAINLDSGSDVNLNNDGLIVAYNNDVINADHPDSSINIYNSGTISNNWSLYNYAIDLGASDGFDNVITNSGNIIGGIRLGNNGDDIAMDGGVLNAGSYTEEAIIGGYGVDSFYWTGGTVIGTIDLGGDDYDSIVIGAEYTDTLETGGSISGVSSFLVAFGTLQMKHNIWLQHSNVSDENLDIIEGARFEVVESRTIHAGDVDIEGTLAVNAGKTLTIDRNFLSDTNVYHTGTIEIGLKNSLNYGKIHTDSMTIQDGGKLHINAELSDDIADGTVLTDVIYSDSAISFNNVYITDNLWNYSFTVDLSDPNSLNLIVNKLFTGDDTLIGDGQDNELRGYEGNDSIYGGAGNDTLLGGVGDDIIAGNLGDDYISGDEGRDRLFGGIGHDQLNGGDGNDVISGSWGNDVLIGGNEADILTGGFGADSFVFENTSDSMSGSTDLINDFTQGVDVIDISGLASEDIEEFSDLNIFTGTNYSFVSSAVVDTDFQIILTGSIALTESDFIFG